MISKGRSPSLRSKAKGFSLLELIIVIAVIAAIGAIVVPTIQNFREQSESSTQNRNIQLWNSVYLQYISAEPSVANETWTSISQKLEDGVYTNIGLTTYRYQVSIPEQFKETSPTFTPGVGIINNTLTP